MIKIRILHLSVLSEDAGDFRHAGLYVVMRVGDEAQRTSVLVEGERKSWDEVFFFVCRRPFPLWTLGCRWGHLSLRVARWHVTRRTIFRRFIIIIIIIIITRLPHMTASLLAVAWTPWRLHPRGLATRTASRRLHWSFGVIRRPPTTVSRSINFAYRTTSVEAFWIDVCGS
ncbi:hypothetical protein TcCL_Unassigned00254 [Trypanosoma cruzi]|nr:hypothetical protein TcCL_Unassigned00254 [Trypanosoma cruzi]